MTKDNFYQSVIKNGPFGYACHEIIFDKNGKPSDCRIIDHNNTYESITGLDPKLLAAKRINEIFQKGKYPELAALYKKLLFSEHAGEVDFYSKSTKKWFAVQIVSKDDGYLLTLFEDISCLKSLQSELENTGYLLIENDRLLQMSKSLAESEASYKSIFDYTIAAIYVLDENGVFIDVNAAATRMYGYEKNEIVGFTPEKLSAPGLNDLDKNRNHIHEAFNGTPQRFDWWGLRKNGEIFPKDVILNKGVYFGRDVVIAMSRDNSELRKTLDALRESEDKYRSLTEQLPVGVYRTNIDGKIVYSNLSLAKILDYDSVEEFLKVNVSQLYANPVNRQRQLSAAEKRAGVIQSEFQLKKKNGDLIWVRDNSRLITDRKGNPAYFDGVLQDITVERNVQVAVKENEANLKAIIENTLENIWSINRNYEIQYVNEVFSSSFLQTFGTQLKPGVNVIDALPDSLKHIWKERYDRALQNEHFLFEDKIEINDTSIYVEVSLNPILVDGTVVGISAYGKDVTEKKYAQLQLQYQSELRKLLVELSSGFINLPLKEINSAINLSLEKIGEFVGADRAYVFRYDFLLETATNTIEWCRQGVSPQKDNLQNIPLEQYSGIVSVHERGEIVKVDNACDLPAGSLKSLLESQDVISLLTIPLIKEGACSGFVGFDSVRSRHIYNDYEQQLLQVYAQTLVNAMERLEKEEKLIAAKEKAEESDRLKSAFLANMSHEIRTPMSGIIGFLNLLNEPDLSEENKSVYINIVTQSGQRLLETINDIIEISKIESGGLHVNLSPVDVSELVGYYNGFFRHQTTQKGLEYVVNNNFPSNIRFFRTDRKKLDSILSNLIKNAIKFTPSGKVEFGCQLVDGKLLFYVKDTGVGIPEGRLDSIFERFVQADISTSRPHEGSGLGLAIVKAYVEMLGGTIAVESKIGKGTKFTLLMPYIEDDSKAISKDTPEQETKSNKEGAKILIAEDDFASYLYIQKALMGDGVTFIRTTNGEDTVAVVKNTPEISAVLMDIKMPGMSGLDATRKIREFNKSIPIIAQTAYSLSGDRDLVIEAGCTDYISKPINRKELQNLIKKYTGIVLSNK